MFALKKFEWTSGLGIHVNRLLLQQSPFLNWNQIIKFSGRFTSRNAGARWSGKILQEIFCASFLCSKHLIWDLHVVYILLTSVLLTPCYFFMQNVPCKPWSYESSLMQMKNFNFNILNISLSFVSFSLFKLKIAHISSMFVSIVINQNWPIDPSKFRVIMLVKVSYTQSMISFLMFHISFLGKTVVGRNT